MIIHRGGTDEERLYLYDKTFMFNFEKVIVKKTVLPGMEEIIARHKARYYIPSFFVRTRMRVLDFPCGSGYGCDIIPRDAFYEGRDYDEVTIEYCKRLYSGFGDFFVEDLRKPFLPYDHYDVIACIEGIEHIEQEYQLPLIRAFNKALKPNGVLVVSSPENPEGISGPSKTNPYHLWELTRLSFTNILGEFFNDVQIFSHKETLHNGQQATCLYGICRKEE